MLNPRVEAALNAQINAEMWSAYLYLSMAAYCHDVVVPGMNALRNPIDELELLVDKAIWPVPTYGDLMFEV